MEKQIIIKTKEFERYMRERKALQRIIAAETKEEQAAREERAYDKPEVPQRWKA